MSNMPPPLPGSPGDPFATSAPPISPGPVMMHPSNAGADGLAIASFVLGILSVVTCIAGQPCINLPLAIAGLVCGLMSKTRGPLRSWGIGLSIAGLALVLVLFFVGAAIFALLGIGAAAAGAAGGTP